jgi:threonine dehydratase
MASIRLFLAALAVLCFALPASADVEPIQPFYQGTKTKACATTTGTVTLATSTSTRQLELTKAGSTTIFVEVGDSGITAAVATGYPILAGQTKVITVDPAVTTLACIHAGSATHTLYVTIGRGI